MAQLRYAAPPSLQPDAIQGKEGIKLCHLATLLTIPRQGAESPVAEGLLLLLLFLEVWIGRGGLPSVVARR